MGKSGIQNRRIPQMKKWVKLFSFDPTAPGSAVAKRLLNHSKEVRCLANLARFESELNLAEELRNIWTGGARDCELKKGRVSARKARAAAASPSPARSSSKPTLILP